MIENKLITKLILEAQNGNEDSFNELYRKTNLILINQVKEILKDNESVYDIIQDSYLKLLQSKMKNEENGLSYLITIARNLAINMYNKRKKEVSMPFKEFESIYNVDTFKRNDSDVKEIMQKYLTPYQIELIELHVIDGLKHIEIAARLNKPIGTIMWQYNEAIKIVRKHINSK